MKTGAELQAAANELLEVCKKHGVVLIGTCSSEGIFGEISIAENTLSAIGWDNPEIRLTNLVEEHRGYFEIQGIGEISQ